MRLPESIRQMKVEDALHAMGVKVPQQCEHIKSNGEFCGSPALRGRNYCYFHLTYRGRRLRAERAQAQVTGLARAYGLDPEAAAAAAAQVPLELPPLEDANSVQIALMQVIDAILHNQLDNKRAGLVLYALQTASSNLHRGANFAQAASAVVAGGYEAFEEDYELADEVPELRVEEDAGLEEDDEDEEEEETEEEENEDDEETDEAEEVKAGEDESEIPPQGAGCVRQPLVAGSPGDPESRARSFPGEADGEDGELLSYCSALDQFFCSIMGPMSQKLGGGTIPRAMREAPRQRFGLRGARPEPQGEEGSAVEAQIPPLGLKSSVGMTSCGEAKSSVGMTDDRQSGSTEEGKDIAA